jgi:hypothetical protein
MARTWLLLVVLIPLCGMLTSCGGGTGPANNEALYEDPDYAPDVDTDRDVPTKDLGGYTFTTTSNKPTHPYLTLKPDSDGIVVEGWGEQLNALGFLDCSYGGVLSGVKTLRIRETVRLKKPNKLFDTLLWLAQDTAGNVHKFKYKNVISGYTASMGVTRGDPACFLLPTNLTVGKTWYTYYRGVQEEQEKVLSLNATSQGQTGLLQIQHIHDDDYDGTYDPSWTGPDDRDDLYYLPVLGLHSRTLTMGPDGGLVRRE